MIEVSAQVRKTLSKVFGVNRVTIWRALHYRDDSEKSRKIRQSALNKGGVVTVTAPECETLHDAYGVMTQRFGNGHVIRVDKTTGLAVLEDKDGRVLDEVPCCTIEALTALQQQAARE